MKNLLLLLFTFLFPNQAWLQAPTVKWVRTIAPILDSTTTLQLSFPVDFTVDKQGNSYLYMSFNSNTQDCGSGVVVEHHGTLASPLIVKIDADGNTKWAKQISRYGATSSLNDFNTWGIAVDETGNVYVSGNLRADTTDFGNDVKLPRNCTSTNCAEAFIAKYNADGELQWVTPIRTYNQNSLYTGKISIGNGALYLASQYIGDHLDFGFSLEYNNVGPNGFFIAKYSLDGIPLHVNFIFSTDIFHLPYLVKVGPGGDIFVASEYSKTIQFNHGPTLITYGPAATASNIFVAHYLPDGMLSGVANLNSNSWGTLRDIEPDYEGGVYVSYEYDYYIKSGNNILAEPVPPETKGNALLYYKNGSITLIRDVNVGNHSTIPFYGIRVDPEGNYYTAGGVFGSVTIDTFIVANIDNADIILASWNKNHQIEWIRWVGGLGDDMIDSPNRSKLVGRDSLGGFYFAGRYSFGGLKLDDFSADGDGLFVAKLNSSKVSTQSPVFKAPALQVRPNPTSGPLYVEIDSDLFHPGWLEIYDLTGRLYQRHPMETGRIDIDPAISNGVYIVVYQTEKFVSKTKLIVQK